MDNPELFIAPTTAEDYVKVLEGVGGDLDAFCTTLTASDETNWRLLFKVDQLLDADDDARKRWRTALDRNLRVRMQYLQSTAMRKLETWSNKSDATSAPDIVYARTILADIFSAKIERGRRSAAFPYLKQLRDAGIQPPTEPEPSEPEPQEDDVDKLYKDMTA